MADVIVGAKLEADASGYIKSVGDIRKEVKLAEKDVIAMSEKFGATSKEAAAAAKRTAELKDKIGDAKSLIDAFNPDTKFRAFGASIQTVVGGFTALTGVMGLLGVESEQVQKTLLKVQSALALSQGIAQLQEGMQAFKNLGSVITQTLGKSGMIGIAIAGVAALGAVLLGVFDGPSVKIKELNNSLKDLAKGEAEAGKAVNETKNAFEQARLGIISKEQALKTYNDGIGKTIGFAKDLNEAEKLTTENAAAYIKVQGLKAQANYILGKSSELEAKARMNQVSVDKLSIETAGIWSDVLIRKGNNLIEAQKSDAAELMTLITGINAEIASASKSFKTVAPAGTPSKGSGKADAEKYITNYKSEYDATVRANEQDITFKKAAQKAIDDQAELDAEASHLAEMAGIHVEYTDKVIDLGWIAVETKKQQHQADLALAAEGVGVLTAASQLLGEETAAGKVLAVAAATISTYLAINKTLAAFAGKPIPGFAIAQAIATGIFGLVQVKKILAVKVPGKSGGGSAPNIGSVSAPLQPALPSTTNTRLDRDQLNQIGNAAVHAYFTETDMNNVETVRRINRAARIG